MGAEYQHNFQYQDKSRFACNILRPWLLYEARGMAPGTIAIGGSALTHNGEVPVAFYGQLWGIVADTSLGYSNFLPGCNYRCGYAHVAATAEGKRESPSKGTCMRFRPANIFTAVIVAAILRA